MAEGIFNHFVLEHKKEYEWSSWSAGINAMEMDKVSKYSVEALKRDSIDISNYFALGISWEMLEGSFLILTMSNSHKQEILSRYPEFYQKIFTVYEYAEGDKFRNIEDPYGYPLEVYQDCADELWDVLKKIWNKLIGTESVFLNK